MPIAFARNVRQGLTSVPKRLSSRYFYDEQGDLLFQRIMQLPEYYLTGSEEEILQTHGPSIAEQLGGEAFDLIELGAGDGYKTKILLRNLMDRRADFRYRPVDISANVLRQLKETLAVQLPDLSLHPLEGDYFDVLEQISRESDRKKVILFLGANIGNLAVPQAETFLALIAANLHPGELLLVGFDLKKDPQLILDAYNDAAGVTAEFNLNLLRRINRELGGCFNLEAFRHWESYDPVTGSAKSYLVSTCEQSVQIEALGLDVVFEPWEAIEVELSQKYSIGEVESLMVNSGYGLISHFFDRRRYFLDTLWRR